MFLLSLLINETSLQIKVDKHLSGKIQTNTGITQGDCLSATLFIFYLASCLNSLQAKENPNNEKFLIEPKYADDITWVTTSKQHIGNAKSKIPIQLAQYNLEINIKKSEEYSIPSITSSQKWKKCKILGSYIHNNTDIENRKIQTINTIKKHNHIFTSKKK